MSDPAERGPIKLAEDAAWRAAREAAAKVLAEYGIVEDERVKIRLSVSLDIDQYLHPRRW